MDVKLSKCTFTLYENNLDSEIENNQSIQFSES